MSPLKSLVLKGKFARTKAVSWRFNSHIYFDFMFGDPVVKFVSRKKMIFLPILEWGINLLDVIWYIVDLASLNNRQRHQHSNFITGDVRVLFAW